MEYAKVFYPFVRDVFVNRELYCPGQVATTPTLPADPDGPPRAR